MTTELENVEFAVNPEQRCACLVLADTSGSMQGPKITALNDGLVAFKQALEGDPIASVRVEVGLVTFDSLVRVISDFVGVADFNPPRLTAQGLTRMAGGITKGLDMIAARKQFYRSNNVPYNRPLAILVTDGEPQGEDEATVQAATNCVAEEERGNRVVFYAVGVQEANMQRLASMVVRPPLKLAGLNFSELFVWLSKSVAAVARSSPAVGQVALPPTTWATT